jgi:hypothetical protein
MPSAAKAWGTGAFLVLFSTLALSSNLRADDAVQVYGFGALRGTTRAGNPLESDSASAQLQAGVDWSPSPFFLVHLHLLGRTDDGQSVNGHFGTPEAYAEAHLPVGERSRIKIRGGAFFLPTSRENVDALWENAYTISSSALNSWFGEEFRPIGLDVSWMGKGATLGATVFRGNDTFGALPLDPGWSLNDRWTVLGQKVRSAEYYASVSAEKDHRLGWSARAGWNYRQFSVLFTHIDNRGDGMEYADIYNWKTRFDVAGFDYTRSDWTLAGETGWGPTELFFPGGGFMADIRASYLLVSRRLPRGRATVRFDDFTNGEFHRQAVTVAGFFTPAPKFTIGVEATAGGSKERVLCDFRYRFSGR